MDQRTRMSSRRTSIAILTLVLSLAVAPPAAAQFGVDGFFSQGDAAARWVDAGAPRSVIELRVAGTSAAMVRFTGFSSSLPAESPTYDFLASTTGSSGGS